MTQLCHLTKTFVNHEGQSDGTKQVKTKVHTAVDSLLSAGGKGGHRARWQPSAPTWPGAPAGVWLRLTLSLSGQPGLEHLQGSGSGTLHTFHRKPHAWFLTPQLPVSQEGPCGLGALAALSHAHGVCTCPGPLAPVPVEGPHSPGLCQQERTSAHRLTLGDGSACEATMWDAYIIHQVAG